MSKKTTADNNLQTKLDTVLSYYQGMKELFPDSTISLNIHDLDILALSVEDWDFIPINNSENKRTFIIAKPKDNQICITLFN